MTSSSLGYEIRDVSSGDGGLDLELWVEGSRVARARVSVDVLHALEETLGTSREEVEADLGRRLQDVLKAQGHLVEILEPRESPEDSLKFVSRFVSHLGDEVTTGVVWYDVTESVTGPESLPMVVRNRMRHEVLRKLTEPGSTARALIDRPGRMDS